MAADIGVRIKLDGEKQYREQLRQITQATKTMHAETAKMESGWDKNTSAMDKNRQKAQLLNSQIEQQKKAVATAKENVDRYTNAYGENDRQTLKWKQTLAEAETELNKLEQDLANMPNRLQVMGQSMQDAGEKIKSVGQKMSSAGKTMSLYVTAPLVAAGTASVKMASDFETAMAKVATISDDSAVNFEDMRSAILDLSNQTGVSAADIAENVYQAISAGQDTADAVAFVEKTTRLAKSGFAETGEALDVLTTILNAYGIESSKVGIVSDKLIQTQNLGKTTVAQLAQNMGQVIPTAAAFSVSLDQLSAGYVTLTKNGIDTALATTALNGLLSELGKTGSKSANVLQKKTGKSFKELMESGYSLGDVLEIVQEGADEAGVSISDMFSNARARRAANSLTQNADDFASAIVQIGDAAGTTDAAFDKVSNTSAAQFRRTLNQLKNTGIDLGQTVLTVLAPAIQKISDAIKSAATWFKNLDDRTKENIVKIGLLAAAIGPVLMVGGKLVSTVGSMVSGIGNLITKLGGLPPMLGGVVGGLGLAVGAGAALGLVIKGLMDHFGFTSTKLGEFNNGLINTVTDARDARVALADATGAMSDSASKAAQAMTDVETSAALAKMYGDELIELGNKTNKTVDDARRMEALIANLNEIYPGFADNVSVVNGELSAGEEEIRAYIDSLHDMAKEQALQAAYADIIEKIVNAERKRIEAEMRRQQLMSTSSDALMRQLQIQQQQEAEVRELTAAQQAYNDLMSSGSATSEQLAAAQQRVSDAEAAVNDGLVLLNGEMVNSNDATTDFATAQGTAADEARKMGEEIAAADEEIASAEEEAAAYQKELDDLQVSTDDATTAQEDLATQTGDTADAVLDAADDIDEAGSEIIATYQQMRDSTYDSTMGQKSMWEELAAAETVSIEQMQTALQQHLAAYTGWNANVQRVMNDSRYGTDATFTAMVNSIMSAGIDMAPYLDAIVQEMDSADGDLSGILATFGDLDTAVQTYSDGMGKLEVATEHGVEAMRTELEGSGVPEAAADMTDGALGEVDRMLEGINGKSIAGYTAGKKLMDETGKGAQAGEKTISTARTQAQREIDNMILGLNGKSASAYSAGKNVSDSAGRGAQDGNKTLTTAANDAQKTVDSANKEIDQKKVAARAAGEAVGGGYAAGMASQTGAVTNAAKTITNAIDNEFQHIRAKTYGWGAEMIQQLANGMNSKVLTVKASAEGIAQTISTPLHHTTPNEGPLKGDDKWGYEFGEQYAASMMRSIPLVANASRELAAAVGNPAYIDPGMLSGAPSLTTADIYEAFSAALEEADMKVIIGTREFGRILRNVGGAA